jgi:hypothetical protein
VEAGDARRRRPLRHDETSCRQPDYAEHAFGRRCLLSAG